MLYNFWILFKLIKSLIFGIFDVVICTIYLQNYYCVKVLQINYLT